MLIGMPPKETAHDLPRKARSATGEGEPAGGPTDRAEFLGDDGVGREYWLLGGRVYAERDGRAFPVCPLSGWGRLRKKLRDTRGTGRGLARGRASAA